MKLTLDEVRRVARLAHLELDQRSEERLRGSLDQILRYMEKLNELDTSDVPPALGVTEEGSERRDDVEEPGLSSEEALANAPDSGQGHFKVPRVIPG
jgi:aspartyl-tRNA(Asn)/glutamyl-tRNA(Gln) amidotransferase subunit C